MSEEKGNKKTENPIPAEHPLEGWFNARPEMGRVVVETEVPAAKITRNFWEN